MKNDSKMMKLVAIVLLLTMVALILVSGTYAKYTSSASESDKATVAKWSFQIDEKEIAVTGTPPKITFDLFDTIKDSTGEDEADTYIGVQRADHLEYYALRLYIHSWAIVGGGLN